MAVRRVLRVLLMVCVCVLSLRARPAAAQVVDRDHDGIPDAVEDSLVLRYAPTLHKQLEWGECFSIFRIDPQTGEDFPSSPLTLYRVFHPTYQGVANPDVLVIAYTRLHDADCGPVLLIPPGLPVVVLQFGHQGDAEPYMEFLRYDSTRGDWYLDSISATAHYAAVCEDPKAKSFGWDTVPYTLSPTIYVGRKKNANHLYTNWGGCFTWLYPGNDVITVPPAGQDVAPSPATFFNVGEPDPQSRILNDLGAINGRWSGEKVWDNESDHFRGGPASIRQGFWMDSLHWQENTTPTSDPNSHWDYNADGGRCTPDGMLSMMAAEIPASGGSGTVVVAVPDICGWRVDGPRADWIHPSAGPSAYLDTYGVASTTAGAGAGSVSFTVDPNPSLTARTGTFLIGTTEFTVNQAGIACTFSLNQSIDIGAGNVYAVPIPFTVGAGECAWNATTDASWLSFSGAISGQGSGQITFDARANDSPSPRVGHIFLGGRTVTVNQTGMGCSYDVSWSGQPFGILGGSGVIAVTATPAACTWPATSNALWIAITATSPTQVTFSVSANAEGHDRSGTLSVAGHTVTVTQAGNAVPVAQITAPASGAMFGRGAAITATASASDADGIARVDFYVDGALAGSDTTAPYSAQLSGYFWGWHSVSAKAVDTLGAEGQAAGIAFAVEPSAIDMPVGNARVSSGFPIGGWTIDLRSTSGTGVDIVTGYAVRLGGGTPIPLGTSNGGVERPDVAALFGPQFRYSGFNLIATSPLAAGTYDVYIAAHMTADGSTHNSLATRVTVLTDVTRGADFDGDLKSDPAVHNTSTGAWAWLTSSSGFVSAGSVAWGGGPYMPVPGDYDGDGKADPGLYEPGTGNWNVLLSGASYTTSIVKNAGGSGWTAVPGDYDGDGKTDFAVYNTTTGVWYGLKSSTSYTTSFTVGNGGTGWTAVPGDYDGDGMTDLGAYQTSTGVWSVRLSSTLYTTTLSQAAGGSGWVPVAADYDGDGKADIAVYNTTSGVWYGLKSSTNYTTSFNIPWGGPGYTPIKGDYDGDGKADLALYVGNGTWSILLSGVNYTTSLGKSLGGLGFVPVQRYLQ